MKKTAIVWRESVYKNDFRCNNCKKKLADDGVPIETALLVAPDYPQKDQDTLICGDCKNPVAIMSLVETDLEGGMYGYIGDFMKGDEK